MSIPDDKVLKSDEAKFASAGCNNCGHSKTDHINGRCSKCSCLGFE